jgi:glycosyltransferase involved in cell wall biosynthesis
MSMSRLASYPFVSVVIPSLGRDERLKETAQDLARQEYPAWECIIVLQGPLGSATLVGIAEALREHLRLFHADELNANLARNIGLSEAKGEVVLFIDDDVEIRNPGFLRAHARHYFNTSTSGVAGQVLGPGVLPRRWRHWLSRYDTFGWLFFPTTYDFPARIACGPSSNLSVRRSSALAVGGMDAQFEKGAHREESDFALRLVKRFGLLQFDPEASLVHLGEPDGGCRSWGHNSGIHPLHHVCGEWYFILRALKLRTMSWRETPFHIYCLIQRQILNKSNLRSVLIVLSACRQSIRGYRLARQKLTAGPRLLGSLSTSCYRELLELVSVLENGKRQP